MDTSLANILSIDPGINNILISLPLKSLLALCESEAEVNRICQDDNFWRKRIEYEFPYEHVNVINHKQYYKQLYQITIPVEIYTDNEFNGIFRIQSQQLDKIRNKLIGRYQYILYGDDEGNIIGFSDTNKDYFFDTSTIDKIYIYTKLKSKYITLLEGYSVIIDKLEALNPNTVLRIGPNTLGKRDIPHVKQSYSVNLTVAVRTGSIMD